MKAVEHRDVDRKLQARQLFHRMEIVVSDGAEVVGLELRRDGAFEEIERRKVRGPAQVIDLIILKIAAVRAAVCDQEERRKRYEENQPGPLGH